MLHEDYFTSSVIFVVNTRLTKEKAKTETSLMWSMQSLVDTSVIWLFAQAINSSMVQFFLLKFIFFTNHKRVIIFSNDELSRIPEMTIVSLTSRCKYWPYGAFAVPLSIWNCIFSWWHCRGLLVCSNYV